MSRNLSDPPQARRRSILKRSSPASEPLLPGRRGVLSPRRASTQTKKIVNGWHVAWRHHPALLRLCAETCPDDYPSLSRGHDIWAMEVAFRDPEFRKSLRVTDPNTVTDEPARRLIQWLKGTKYVGDHWVRHTGMALHRQDDITRASAECFDGGTVRMWELAHFDLPDHLKLDTDITWMVARCQGMSANFAWMVRRDYPDYGSKYSPRPWASEVLYRAAKKVFRDRWVRFAMACPWMMPLGVDLGSGFSEDVRRMEHLLEWPYQATTGELSAIEDSWPYKKAWEQVCHHLRNPSTLGIRMGPILWRNRYRNVRMNPLDEWCIFARATAGVRTAPKRRSYTRRKKHGAQKQGG